MYELIINFTTTEADQDIYQVFIKPILQNVLGYSATATDNGFDLNLSVLFTSDYTGNITVQNRTSKAYANATFNFDGFVNSLVISENSTEGQVRLIF